MASISKDSRNGRWLARYRDPSGRQRMKSFQRKADAQAFLDQQGVDVRRGEWIDPAGGKLLFGAWCEQWWKTTVDLRPSTRVRDAGYLDRYVLPMFKDRPVGQIHQLEVKAFVAELAGRGLAPATVTKAYQLLGKVMAAAVDGGIIATSPCRRVSLPKIEREEMRFLTPQQVADLAETIDRRYRALVLLGAYGGLRIGELAGLKRSRLDLLRSRVTVAENVVEVQGRLEWGIPKTKAGRRTVVIPRPVANELAAHLTAHAGSELVFPAPEGGPLRTPAWRRRFWQPATVAADLSPWDETRCTAEGRHVHSAKLGCKRDWLRPHDLRHTAVAIWIAAGANLIEVSRRAGHTSVSFTLDRYGHLFEDADQALAEKLEGVFVAPTPTAIAPITPLRADSTDS